MIVSDSQKFVFVHIPKCAGTSVRQSLECFDDRDGFYTEHVGLHPELGLLDYVHIPLFTLRQYFEAEYTAIKDYWSFCVLRDPYSRFPSSISQRMKMYSKKHLKNLSNREIQAEIEHTIEFLEHQPKENHLLPAEYIHFQKQVDYIQINGERVVKTIFTVDEIERLHRKVEKHVGQNLFSGNRDIELNHQNRTLVHRNEALRRLMESSRPMTRLLNRLLSGPTRETLRNFVYVPRDERLKSLFDSNFVKNFINEYYQEDIALWKDVIQARSEAEERHP